jgi:hypothetical protein
LVGSSAPETGRLLVSVGAPSGDVPIEVYVDGKLGCRTAPCLVQRLEGGTHFVHVVRAGSKPTAQLAAIVTAGQESRLHVDLVESEISEPAPRRAVAGAEPASAASKLEAPSAALQEPPASVTTAAVQAAPARTVAPRAARPQSQLAAAPAARAAAATTAPSAPVIAPAAPAATSNAASDSAVLRITSVPSVGVTVDGQPVGRTPRVVRVAPGTHRVAFFNSEGRTTRTVTVGPGASADVSPQ